MKKIVAILLAVIIVFSFSGCLQIQVNLPASMAGLVFGGNTAGANTEEPASSEAAQPTEADVPTEATGETQEQNSEAETPVEPDTQKNENETQANNGDTKKSPEEMSADEIIACFNTAVNKVKSDKIGFKKSKLTSVLDLHLSNSAANSVVSIVKKALLSDSAEETTVKKGESSVDVMSPSGCDYASKLTAADVTSAKAVKSGNNTVITLTFKDLTNPDKSSIYGKVFDFATVDDVLNNYAAKVGAQVARKDVEVAFSGCNAVLTLDANGKIVKYTTYVKATMNMKNATIKKVITISSDVSVTLASTTEYTDFIY